MELDRKFLKDLWDLKKVLCPKCGKDYLVPLHKNSKDDFKCPSCKEVYRTINILNKLLKEGK